MAVMIARLGLRGVCLALRLEGSVVKRRAGSVGRSVCRSYGGRPEGGRIGLWKPAAFTIVVGVSTYSLSAVYREELRRQWIAGTWPHPLPSRGPRLWSQIRTKWLSMSPADRFTFTIIAVNAGVFLLWRVPSLHVFMERYFLSSVANRRSLPLLLSGYSHMEVWHVGLNMLVLWSFAPSLLRTLGDGLAPLHSWPYYITGGVFAAMVGHYARVIRGSPMASLGASGAIMAVISLVVFNNPDSHVYIIFLPFIPIPASWALAGVVTMDTVGLLRGWQMFDHAGHLGGVLFAVLYNWWLHRLVARGEGKVCRCWQRVRTRWSGGRA